MELLGALVQSAPTLMPSYWHNSVSRSVVAKLAEKVRGEYLTK